MEYSLFNRLSMLQMLYDNSLEQLRGDMPVPDTLGVNHHDWTAGANAKTWRFAALHAGRTEEKALPLEK